MSERSFAPAHPDQFSLAPPTTSARRRSAASNRSQSGISSSATPARAAQGPRIRIPPRKRSFRPPQPPALRQEFLLPTILSPPRALVLSLSRNLFRAQRWPALLVHEHRLKIPVRYLQSRETKSSQHFFS